MLMSKYLFRPKCKPIGSLGYPYDIARQALPHRLRFNDLMHILANVSIGKDLKNYTGASKGGSWVATQGQSQPPLAIGAHCGIVLVVLFAPLLRLLKSNNVRLEKLHERGTYLRAKLG